MWRGRGVIARTIALYIRRSSRRQRALPRRFQQTTHVVVAFSARSGRIARVMGTTTVHVHVELHHKCRPAGRGSSGHFRLSHANDMGATREHNMSRNETRHHDSYMIHDKQYLYSCTKERSRGAEKSTDRTNTVS